MKLKKTFRKLFRRKEPDCATCDYALGLIKTLVNPCPACRERWKSGDIMDAEDLRKMLIQMGELTGWGNPQK